jgi:methionyl-tRNA formyltransferase
MKAKLLKFLTRYNKKQTLRSLARQMSVPYFLLQRGKKNGLASFVKTLNPDIICVASMSELLPKEVFSMPPFGTINFHPALLPQYRGPRSFFWQYYFMEPETGVTIHYIDEGEDTGDIIRQKSIPIFLGMKSGELVNEITIIGAALMAEALDDISKGTVQSVPQKHLPCPFRARREKKGEELIDWNWPIERIWHFLRGTAYQDKSFKYRLPGSSWIVRDFKKGETDGTAGMLKISLQGFYMTHREGKIFVTLKWSLIDFARDLYHFALKLTGQD